jgi:signal transduction histidine kinase
MTLESERLYQAFRNIFLNAIKYTDGGRINVDGNSTGFVE